MGVDPDKPSEHDAIDPSSYHPTAPITPPKSSERESVLKPPPQVDWLPNGTSIPGYTIKDRIGAGGMGAVYLAEQARPRRIVALKLVRPDSVTPESLRRFEYEAQILARLRHPGIAQVYEFGSHDAGPGPMPYFAMEYISGAKVLTEYAESKHLSTRERLELFLGVCEAVQHGHQRGIIHRDLKPANILVDSSGVPKVIDFGVARAADTDAPVGTMLTTFGQLIGTVQYMAPEQCSGDPDLVDTRSDVYGLGMVLYELLTGALPYTVKGLPLLDATRMIYEHRVPPPSSHLRELRGDIDTIVLKSLEKDREDRYQSVDDLAEDIERFLENRPIHARPIGAIGKLGKWVKRNRELAAVIAVASAVLIVVSAVLISGLVSAERKATAALAQAQEELIAKEQSIELVRDMLQFKDDTGDSLIRAKKVDVEVMLDNATERLTEDPPEQVATEAEFRALLGDAYVTIDETSKAVDQQQHVLRIREQAGGEPTAELANAHFYLGKALYWARESALAQEHYEQSLAIRRQLYKGDHPDIAYSLTHLGACAADLGDLEESRRLYEEALEMRRRIYKGDHEQIAASLNNVARPLRMSGRHDEAETYLRASLSMIREVKGEQSAEVGHALNNLGVCLLDAGRYDESIELLQESLEIRKGIHGEDHYRTSATLYKLAEALTKVGRFEEAEAHAEDAEAYYRAIVERGDGADDANQRQLERVTRLLDEIRTASAANGG